MCVYIYIYIYISIDRYTYSLQAGRRSAWQRPPRRSPTPRRVDRKFMAVTAHTTDIMTVYHTTTHVTINIRIILIVTDRKVIVVSIRNNSIAFILVNK